MNECTMYVCMYITVLGEVAKFQENRSKKNYITIIIRISLVATYEKTGQILIPNFELLNTVR